MFTIMNYQFNKVRRAHLFFIVAACISYVISSGFVHAGQSEMPGAVLFRNVRVFDGKNDHLQNEVDVLVVGNVIKEISHGELEAPEEAMVINGDGRVLMPRPIGNTKRASKQKWGIAGPKFEDCGNAIFSNLTVFGGHGQWPNLGRHSRI